MGEFNPYAPPETDLDDVPLSAKGVSGCWQDGDLLVMTKDGQLPDRCIKCNAPAEGYRLKRTLMWHNPAYYFLVLINLFVYVIVAMIVRYTAKITVGLCPLHRRRRRRAILIGWLSVPLGIAVMIVGASTPSVGDWALAAGLIGGMVILLAGIIYGVSIAQVISVKRIDKRFIRLARVDPDYLDQFPVWLE